MNLPEVVSQVMVDSKPAVCEVCGCEYGDGPNRDFISFSLGNELLTLICFRCYARGILKACNDAHQEELDKVFRPKEQQKP